MDFVILTLEEFGEARPVVERSLKRNAGVWVVDDTGTVSALLVPMPDPWNGALRNGCSVPLPGHPPLVRAGEAAQ